MILFIAPASLGYKFLPFGCVKEILNTGVAGPSKEGKRLKLYCYGGS